MPSSSLSHRATQVLHRSRAALPGMLLCVAVTGLALALQALEIKHLGRAWLEALVLAILLGTLIRTLWPLGVRWKAGIDFSAKTLLELAVVLLGASISAGTVLRSGPALLIGIAAVVGVAVTLSYALGRAFGLPRRLAMLIACGNSICGNSAIAAVAPVIGADAEDVTASIAFTAVLGVLVVLGLPVLAAAAHMTPRGFGVFAGLTVYAVPQVLAATAPAGALAAQVGTLVKLVRVLMLGPVVLVLSMLSGHARRAAAPGEADGVSLIRTADARPVPPGRPRLLPWFIVGFMALMALRSAGALPQATVTAMGQASSWLTVISMAALGLGVDVRVVAQAGPRVASVVSLSLLALGAVAWLLIRGLGIDGA